MQNTKLICNIPVPLKHALEDLAHEEHTSVSDIVRRILEGEDLQPHGDKTNKGNRTDD